MNINIKSSKILLSVTTLTLPFIFSVGTAQAALQCRSLDNNPRTPEAYYDTALNLTWAQDANLFRTQLTANPNLIRQIIAAIGSVHDLPNAHDNPVNSGTHFLTDADFSSDGTMSWFGAQAFVSWLNLQGYGGQHDWRLTSGLTSSGAFCPQNCEDSEFQTLFVKDLGGIFGTPIMTQHNGNFLLFSNITNGIYWNNTEEVNYPFGSWVFSFDGGIYDPAGDNDKNFRYLAWPVRAGNTGVRCQ